MDTEGWNHGGTDIAFDDVIGEELDPTMVKQARAEEIRYYYEPKVVEKAPLEQCWRATGRALLKGRWIDIHKGDRDRPKYRSRWVATQFKQRDNDDRFAATPPTECLRILLSGLVTQDHCENPYDTSNPTCLLFTDVPRAFFYAPVRHEIVGGMCDEAKTGVGDDQRCARLQMSMYGTKGPAQN